MSREGLGQWGKLGKAPGPMAGASCKVTRVKRPQLLTGSAVVGSGLSGIKVGGGSRVRVWYEVGNMGQLGVEHRR